MTEAKDVARTEVEKMRAVLVREGEALVAQRQRLVQALAETDAMIQRGQGAIVVIDKLLEPPAAADVPAEKPAEALEPIAEAA